MSKIFLMLIFLILSTASVGFSGENSFSREDRDRLRNVELRLERVEAKVDEGQKGLQRQIDDLKITTQKEFDDLRAFLFWGFGILFGGMGMLIGFVMWDRRTALAPVSKKAKELEEREELLEKALKEYAKIEPRFADILKALRM